MKAGAAMPCQPIIFHTTNMRNKSTFFLLFFGLLLILTAARKEKTTIFMIGDSTMANKPIDNGQPERGWGMALQGFFTDDIIVDNHAVNGRSSKSFIDEGRWDKVLEKIKPGDYVVIQFGHNDEKPKEDRHTDPGTTFDANLTKFVVETREKGGIPILCNAVVRRNFQAVAPQNDDDEKLRDTEFTGEKKTEGEVLVDTHGDYRIAPKNVAETLNVPFIDANAITHELEQSLGVEGSKALHMWFKPGENPSIPKGREDNTHYNIYGAHVVAGLLVDEIAKHVPALKKYVRHYDFIVAKDGHGNYMDLQKAVDEAPVGKKTTIRILNGEWKRPFVPRNKKIKFSVSENAKLEK